MPHITLKTIANNPDIKEGMSRKEIDAAILSHAETETLFDKPYEERSRLRVTGPFTVESLSPHRTISVEKKKELATKPSADGFTVKGLAGSSFTNTILENLKKAGVQNTVKKERLASRGPANGSAARAATARTTARRNAPRSASVRSSAPWARNW